MKRVYVLLLTMLALSGRAQMPADTLSRHHLFIELGGQGGFYSLGYESVFNPAAAYKFSVTGGVGFFPYSSGPSLMVAFPLSFNVNRAGFEGGLGFTTNVTHGRQMFNNGPHNYSYRTVSYTSYAIVPRVGMRFQNPNKHLYMKIALTPHIRLGEGFYSYRIIQPWMGVTFGCSL